MNEILITPRNLFSKEGNKSGHIIYQHIKTQWQQDKNKMAEAETVEPASRLSAAAVLSTRVTWGDVAQGVGRC